MTYFCEAAGLLFEALPYTCEYGRRTKLNLIFSPSCLLFFGGGWREQLSRAEEKMNGLDGCYCERTCSVKGVVYREDEGWTDGCRNCTCSVGLHTLDCVCLSVCLCVCVCLCMRTWWVHGCVCQSNKEQERAFNFN